MPNVRTWLTVAAALALAGASPSPARADDRAAAEALFNAAKELMGQGKAEEACPKFEASYKLDKTLGTLLNLADCHEKTGKIATAWAEWAEGVDRATKAADSRADYAKQRRDALTGKLPKLQITVTNKRPGLDVLRDETRVDEAVFGVPLPIDPGKHAIVVKRGEQVIERREVEVAEGATATVTLDLEAIEKAAPPPPPAPTTTAGGLPPPPPPSGSQKTVGFVVGGVGLAAVVAAGALEILALSKKPGDADKAKCVNKFCTTAGLDDVNSAKTFADVGQWVGIGGLVALAVGATLVLTAPKAAPPPPKTGRWIGAPRGVSVAPWAAPTGAGVAVGGRL